MGRIQEAKYIHVIWQDQATAKKIVESHDALQLEPIDDNTVEVDVVSYSKIDDGIAGQFAIRLESQTLDVPSVKLANGTSTPLIPVTDPVSGLRWWVEGKTWDKQNGWWLSDIYRGVGEVQIQIGSQLCRVKISTSTFTHQQLERYLMDFQTDFWELILDESSYITAPAQENNRTLLDETTLRAIARFIDCVELVLQNPKVELREVQRLKPRKYVRPVPRTFMEIATRGITRSLTSRAYLESWDIPENRYAHYALRKVYQITKMLCSVAASQERSLERRLAAHEQRLSNFSNQKTINKEAEMHDLKDTESAIRKLKHELSEHNNEFAELVRRDQFNEVQEFEGKRVTSLQVLLLKRAERISLPTYFAKVRTSENLPWYPDLAHEYATIELGDFSDKINDLHGCEFEISGEIGYEKKVQEIKTRHKFKLLNVSRFMLVKLDKLEKLKRRLGEKKSQVSDLEGKGWMRPLTNKEDQQQQRDIDSIKKLNELLETKHLNLTTLRRELAPKLPSLRAALKAFEKEKVKLDTRFPNSMTYVQNPAYQGIHVAFAKIKEGSGINDDEILLAMDRIEAIGLVNVSLLYERWCLLQIIKVLIQLQYRPEEGWKRKLITQVLDKGRNISIDFENSDLSRKISLRYEWELGSGKRPDFILDVSATFVKNEPPVTKRFVMDAKFYEDIDSGRHGGLKQVIYDLYIKKDYSESRENAVFIVHPSPKAAPSRATPQSWSRDSYYGEIPLFDWDEDAPDHRYGGIYLSPIDTGSYLDHLQRAIGMFLQYGMEINEVDLGGNGAGALPKNGVFCMVCGSSEVAKALSPNNANAWWVTCCNCKHFTTYNFCKCKNRLIKNGEYWSYHAMEPLNPINIKCPSCGDLF